MEVKFLGQSGFCLRDGAHEVLVDPFLSGNPVAKDAPESFSPSHILLSHAHGDHTSDTEAIARRAGATVVSSAEIAGYYTAKGLSAHGMNVGGSYQFAFGRVKFTPAWHSSSFPDGTYGGMPMGILIDIGGRRLYHAGDTGLFSDMQLIGEMGLDVAMLPIGDNFTMGPEDAVRAAQLLKAKTIVPMHYNTFDLIKQDGAAFKADVERDTQSACVVLDPGQSIEV